MNSLKKTQPYSMEAEVGVLGCILTGDNEALIKTLEIFNDRTNVFYLEINQKIFNVCLDLYRQNRPVDWISMTDYLQTEDKIDELGGKEYIINLIDCATLSHYVEQYAKIIKEKALFREMIKVGEEIALIGYQAKDIENSIDVSQNKVFTLSQNRDTRQLTALSGMTTQLWDDIEERAKSTNPLLGLDSGFKSFNNLTLGLQKSDFIVVAARPSMGKTAFCLNIAENVAVINKVPVAIFSLEMTREQLAQRLLASSSGIDSQKLRTGKNIQDYEWDKINVALGTLSEMNIYIDDTPSMTVMDIRAKARRLKAGHGDLGMIIVDYIQLMRGNSDNRVQEISEISRGLKTLARELKIPVIALSQLSRAVETRNDKRPMLSDLRESGAIEQDADIVAFLYRHEYYEPNDVENRGTCEIILAKQRNGPVGTCRLLFNGATTKFKDLL